VNFGYEFVERLGPPHQPIFVIIAWAKLPNGNIRSTDRIEAGSKKEARFEAATALLALLEADAAFGGTAA
jgi:dsRNA-specific ribonuclease